MTPNYTTDYMQSLELLQAGLDRETADYVHEQNYEIVKTEDGMGGAMAFERDGFHVRPRMDDDLFSASIIPAWSMPRLWELLHKAGIYFYEYSTNDAVEHVMESLVYAVERSARKGFLKK